jgi:hypothetical protein
LTPSLAPEYGERGFAWWIRAWGWIGCTGIHPIHHGTRIRHHVREAVPHQRTVRRCACALARPVACALARPVACALARPVACALATRGLCLGDPRLGPWRPAAWALATRGLGLGATRQPHPHLLAHELQMTDLSGEHSGSREDFGDDRAQTTPGSQNQPRYDAPRRARASRADTGICPARGEHRSSSVTPS